MQEKGLACWVADVRSKDLPLVFISSFGGNLQTEPGTKQTYILDWLIDLLIFFMDGFLSDPLSKKGF